MRKTKIICTIGPSSENKETLIAMCKAGMNVARLNFSHGTYPEHQKKIDLIKEVRDELKIPLGLLLDTKGPEYRIGTFKNGKITVQEDADFTFTILDVEGDETRVSVNYKGLCEDLSVGDRILVNNGMVIFEVQEIESPDIRCKVLVGGVLSNRKSMSFPNKVMSGPYLSEQDKQDLLFGIQNGVDFVAASFVSTKQDMVDLKNFLVENGGGNIDLIAKIENRSGVDHAEEICEIADGIMIARGDLGVEIPYVEVPAVQKRLTSTCRMLGKRVITATEMLESMIHNPRPTRAEISDVANAVYDYSSAVMLSGETAAGEHPVEAVEAMAHICEYTESQITYRNNFFAYRFLIQNNLDALSHATCAMAINVDAKAIAVCSVSGKTATMVSRFRVPIDIVGITTDPRIYRRLALSWGVIPVLAEEFNSMDVMFYHAMASAKKVLALKAGDNVVLTGGPINGSTGNTNTIKVETVTEHTHHYC